MDVTKSGGPSASASVSSPAPEPQMSIVKFRPADALQALPAPAPVKAPLGVAISQVSVRSFPSAIHPASRPGVWECSPGVWRRQVLQAEFCLFLDGEAVFTPDGGEPIAIGAGDAVYFPADTAGVWEITRTARKLFIVFDEAS